MTSIDYWIFVWIITRDFPNLRHLLSRSQNSFEPSIILVTIFPR